MSLLTVTHMVIGCENCSQSRDKGLGCQEVFVFLWLEEIWAMPRNLIYFKGPLLSQANVRWHLNRPLLLSSQLCRLQVQWGWAVPRTCLEWPQKRHCSLTWPHLWLFRPAVHKGRRVSPLWILGMRDTVGLFTVGWKGNAAKLGRASPRISSPIV